MIFIRNWVQLVVPQEIVKEERGSIRNLSVISINSVHFMNVYLLLNRKYTIMIFEETLTFIFSSCHSTLSKVGSHLTRHSENYIPPGLTLQETRDL